MKWWAIAVLGIGPSFGSARAPDTEAEKTPYAMGAGAAKELIPFSLTPQEIAWVERGMLDAANGKQMPPEALAKAGQINRLLQRRRHKLNERFIAQAAKAPGAKKFPKGFVLTETQPGQGESPGPTDAVKLAFQGALTDGTIFESTYKRGAPAVFVLERVIPCWTFALQNMKAGGKYTLVCPSELAYGEEGFRPLIPPGSVLVFEMQPIEVLHKKPGDDGGTPGSPEALSPTPFGLPTPP